MLTVIDGAVKRYRSIFMVLLFFIIGGIYSYQLIPKERMPDVQIPTIFVSVHFEGVSPEDGERILLRPLERELRTIDGLKDIFSYARESNVSVVLEFDPDFDSSKALQDVREAVDIAKADFPEDADEPEVIEINLGLLPVVNVSLMGSIPDQEFIELAKILRDKIEELPEILSVEIAGEREKVLEVTVPPLLMQTYQFDLQNSIQGLLRNHALIAAGSVNRTSGEYPVKVPGLIEKSSDLFSMPVTNNEDVVVTLEDIATVRKSFKEPTGFARVNGQKALVLEVSKRKGSNVIETIEKVRTIVKQESKFWPKNMAFLFSQDESKNIIGILVDLQNNIILAVILVMIILIAVVGFRSAILVGIVVPGSFLMSMLFLYLFGLTLNIVVLFSLILSVGMLVDSAIVVTEYANRKLIKGMSHKQAYSYASRRMSWPIMVSTLTTIVVFMPLIFWPGVLGQFMQYLPMTIIITLTSSLLMALIFIPTIGSRIGKPKAFEEEIIRSIRISEAGDLEELSGIYKWYVRLIEKTLRNAKKFALSMVGILCVVYLSYGFFGPGVEFFPKIEPENIVVKIHARGNLSPWEKDALSKEVEERLMTMTDELRIIYARSGKVSTFDNPEDVVSVILIELMDFRFRRKSEVIIQDIVERTKDIAGIQVEIQEQRVGPSAGKPIEVELSSRFPEMLPIALKQFHDLLDNLGGLRNVEDNSPIPAIEWEMKVDREEAARYGGDITLIGKFIQLFTNGILVTDYLPDDSEDEVDIRLRFPPEYRHFKQLSNLYVNTPKGSIPMSNFVEPKAAPKVSQIIRSNNKRSITVKADVQAGILADDMVKALRDAVANGDFDPRVRVQFRGEDEDQKETADFLKIAFTTALFVMALILVTEFNSVYQMFIILSAVFLSTVGVLLGLLVTNQPFGIVMCGVAIIALSGIVVNNNIIFIDTYHFLRNQGMSAHEALVRTGVKRLRPILLTAGTTVLGLIPMAMGMSLNFITREVTFGAPSSQWWNQLATAIAGGLAFATILTLFLTPSLLMIAAKRSGSD